MNGTPKVDVKALAELARLDLSEQEVAKLEKEIPDILKFVEQIQSAAGAGAPESPEHRNVLREDANPHESGRYTEILLKAAPKEKDGRIVVKQVVSRKSAQGRSTSGGRK